MASDNVTGIESIFAIDTSICGYCNGARSLKNEDGTYSPCRCVYKESFLKYLGDLKRYVTLASTPLLEHLKENRNLVIEFSKPSTLNAHIKTALLHRKDLNKTWKIMTPDEIMSRSFGDDTSKRDLYSADLLIIIAVAFPFYEAAGKQHEYVMKTRQALGKVTWFCTGNLEEFLKRSDIKGITKDFKDVLCSYQRMAIKKTTTVAKAKTSTPLVEEDLKMGIGINGVDRKYLGLSESVLIKG